MLGLGGRTLLYMGVMVYVNKAADFPWVHVADFMIAFCGLLLSVGCVGVLIGRRQSGVKSRFAAGMLATLWIVLAFLVAIVEIRFAYDAKIPLNAEFWKPTATASALLATWAIIPFLLYLWCWKAAEHDLKN